MEKELLKQGDNVVMHTCIEAEKYNGKIWTCKTDEYTKGEGVYKQNLVFLEGFSGCFATEYLQKINLSELAEIDKINVKFITELDVDLTNEDIEDDDRATSFTIYECCKCHWRFVGECNRYGYGYTSEGVQTPNYCPMCGGKIEDCIED